MKGTLWVFRQYVQGTNSAQALLTEWASRHWWSEEAAGR